MSGDLVSDLIDKLDEKGTSVFEPSASMLKRVGDFAGTSTDRESLDEGSHSDALRGTIVYKTEETNKNFDLCLKFDEETATEAAMYKASRKLATGTIFSVRIDLTSGGLLSVGVKELQLKMLTVIMLKRKGKDSSSSGPNAYNVGAAEAAGLCLGDVIFGVNFAPARDGAKSLQKVLKKNAKCIHLQCWRCNQLCPSPAPGLHFPRMDDVIVKAFQLYRDGVFSDWERWNFVDILLNHMLLDLKQRQAVQETFGEVLTNYELGMVKKVGQRLSIHRHEAFKQLQVVDLERNILHAKCLRTALCVRMLHTKPQTNKSDSVVYVLRVEDVETGLQWVVHRRYRDFHALHEDLEQKSRLCADIPFPQKRISLLFNTKLVESRMVALENYLRRVLYTLSSSAVVDPHASCSLRHVQIFLGVDKYIDCIYPPPVDDQRHIELLAFKFLNDYGSPSCQQCTRFVNNVDLEALMNRHGHQAALQHLSEAITEVEQFTLTQHQERMRDELKARRPEMSGEAVNIFVRRCVRRQVEAALFLPLRREIFRILVRQVRPQAQTMQVALHALSSASPSFFMVDNHVAMAPSLGKVISKFRDIVYAYLPADQGQLLMHAAAAVMELHSECKGLKCQQFLQSERKAMDMLNQTDRESESKAPPAEQGGGDIVAMNPSRRRSEPGALSVTPNPEEEIPAASSPSAVDTPWDSIITLDQFSNGPQKHHEPKQEQTPEDDFGLRMKNRDAERRWSLGIDVDGVRGSGNNVALYSGGKSPPAPAIKRVSQGTPEMARIGENGLISSGLVQAARGRRSTISGISQSSLSLNRDRASTTVSSGSVRGAVSINFGSEETLLDPVKAIFHSYETLPAVKLYRDDENVINPSDLSFLEPFFAEEQIAGTTSGDIDTIPTPTAATSLFPVAAPAPAPDSDSELDKSMTVEPATPARTGEIDPKDDVQGVPMVLSAPHLAPPTDAGVSKEIGTTETATKNTATSLRTEIFSPSIETSASRERRSSTGSAIDISKAASALDDRDFGRRVRSMKAKPFSTSRKGFETLEIGDGEGEGEGEGGGGARKKRGQGRAEGRDRPIATPPDAEGGLIFRLTNFSPLGGLSSPGPHDRDTGKEDDDRSLSIDSFDDPALRDATVDRLSEGGHGTGVGHRKRLPSVASMGGSELGDEEHAKNTSDFYTGELASEAVSADDFLPMFTFALAQSALPQLLIIKELMTNLVSNEETYGECGYYLATLEASLTHIMDLYGQYERERGRLQET